MTPPGLDRPALQPTIPSAPAGRTLVVFHLAETSGPSLSLRAEVAWLAGGGPVEVVVPAGGPVAEEYGRFSEVTTLDYAPLTLRTAARMARDVRTLRAHVRRTRPARVLVVTTALPTALAAARAEHVPALLYAGELVPTGPGLARRLGGALVLGLARRRAGAVVCCSRTVARQFESHPAPVFVAYPPIAADVAGDGAALRARLGIAPDAACVAAVGSIGRARGQDLLVRAVPQIRERFPDVRVVVAGAPHPRPADRRYAAELRRLARRLGVEAALAWPGYVERARDVYAAADVVVNPTRREAFGRVAAEALVAERPVVATRVEAVPEVLRDGVDSLLVPPEDPDALAAATVRLLESPALRERLARVGGQRVLDEFSPARSLAEFARAVAALPGGRGPRLT
jgi:glycosyltransferase involved in cell wall biosynthesis